MNFTALKAEVAARGFDYLSDARLGTMVNNARAELDEPANGLLWPYRESSATGGPPPLLIPDLGTVETVLDLTTNFPIWPRDYRWLVTEFGDLAVTGTPVFWYLGTPGGTIELATYPVATGQIGVQYWRTTPDLVAGTDVPAAPTRFHKVIVDIAVRDAYRDSDNFDAADRLQVQIDRDIDRMRMALLGRQVQAPDRVIVRHALDG